MPCFGFVRSIKWYYKYICLLILCKAKMVKNGLNASSLIFILGTKALPLIFALMKNLLFVFGAVVLFACSSCNQGHETAAIVNKWKLANVKYSKELSPELQPIIDAQLAQLKQTFSLEYKANGTYVAKTQKEITGKWELSSDGKTLENIEDGGQPVKYTVLHLSKDSLAWKTKLDGEELIFEFIPQ